MPDVKRCEIVPYTPEQMYALVDNVEQYKEFLPGCQESIVHSRTEDEVNATLSISASGLSKSFTTLNRLQKNKMIEIRLVNGPFKQLEGFWRFDPVNEGKHCQITFDLHFEFSGFFLDMMIGPVFSQIANSLVDAFQKRAAVIYTNAEV
jgi:ribosome-associated toxin RatA of RatAB toxin-antitoxin module